MQDQQCVLHVTTSSSESFLKKEGGVIPTPPSLNLGRSSSCGLPVLKTIRSFGMIKNVKKYLVWSFFLSCFIIFSLASTGPVPEGDTFWHIKTGEWIWKHKAIPSEDIYSYTTQGRSPIHSHSVRQDLILKGYWLSQPVFYVVYDSFGIPGIVIMRALVVTLLLFVLYLWMKKLGIRLSLAILVLVIIGFYMKDTGDRPHYLSFLFFLLAAILLEQFRLWSRGSHIGPPAFLLCLLMLIWANMHGGYVMGVILILFYVPRTLYRAVKGTGSWLLPALLLLAVFVTLLNPNHYKVFLGLWYEMREGVQFQNVAEMMPSWKAALLGYYNVTFWIALMVAACILLVRGRRMPLEHLGLLVFMGIFAVMVQRIIPFFLVLMPFVVVELEATVRNRYVTLFRALAGVSLLLFLALLIQNRQRVLDFSLDELFPVESTAFLNDVHPKGNLFNYSDWGGYLMLYAPQFKVSHDGRRLLDDMEAVHAAILLGSDAVFQGVPLWKAYLDVFNVEIILVPSVTPHMREYCPLVERLYRDSRWSLVYRDKVSLLYLRNNGQNDEIIHAHSLPKDLSLIDAIGKLHTYSTAEEQKRNAKIIGDLYTLMNRPEDAVQYYQMLR